MNVYDFIFFMFFFFKQKTAYEMRISDWSSDVCSSDLVPQRLEERVGEAQRHDVLHRLLAEIVVDAEDLVLLEDRADGVVHRLRGPGVLADRLFQHHARLPADQALPCRGLADRPEQPGGDGQVEQAAEGIGGAGIGRASCGEGVGKYV